MRRTVLALPLLAFAACGGAGDAADQATAAPKTQPAAGRPNDTQPWSLPSKMAATCTRENLGITLPDGFCAVIVGDGLGAVRHLAVAENGDVYAGVNGRRGQGGGVLALRDTDGDGRADQKETFYSRGGTGVALHGGYLYFAPDDGVVRWRMTEGQLVPSGEPETIVSGLPTGGHSAKSMVFDGQGNLFVNIGSQSNSCQQQDRQNESPGKDPCPELTNRAGTWRFSADRANQRQADGERWATGIRNGLAIAWNPQAGALFGVSHGRDQLSGWGFTAQQNAEKPAEEMFRLAKGTDGGWPYCYYDPAAKRKVMAPEYGGNGSDTGRCAGKADPVAYFPAHWAPNALLFYTGTQFPEQYRNGAFVAFHGSWNRAPLPQQGYNVTFQPFANGAPSGDYSVFAQTPAGAGTASEAQNRPTGLAMGPDGSLYVADDEGGRIWRIMYVGAGR